MLQAIREKAQGWIAWAIVIFISIPFALWGIQEYLGVGGEVTVAEVEGQEITDQALEENTRRFREQLRANLGSAYQADLFSEQMLRRQTLNQMIDELVLQITANDWGMRASDQMVVDAIASERAFQVDGRFDHALYQTVLRNNGLSEGAYEASIRQGLALEQLQAGVSGSAFATKAEVEAYERLIQQQRTLAYAVVPADKYLGQASPDEAAIKAYYDSHQSDYQLPEQVRLDYLMLDVESLSEAMSASEQDVASYFEQHSDEFIAPEERRLRHILIPIEKGDEAAALAKASELHDQLMAGADFAGLAKDHSADPGSAADGGDLGWVSKGIMVEPFEKAAFALAEGAISEPVKSPFGFHLIQVQGIRGGGDATLDQVYDQVSAAYRRAEVERDFYERAERLAELAYENPDNLAVAAETLGLTVQHSDWISRSGGQGDLASPKVSAAAFSEDVLQGNNSELLELSPEKLLVLRVSEHQESRARGLDEVRQQVLQAVRHQQAAELAQQAGEQALERLRGGADLADLSASSGWEFKASKRIGRSEQAVPAAVRELAFSLARPAGGSPVVAATELAGGDYALVALSEVHDDVGGLDSSGRQLLGNRIATMSGQAQLTAMMRALREQADVSIMLSDKPAEE
jgi:peptidyl-prolyl cis-trans isomerase D